MNECAIILTRDTYYQVIHELWRTLPPPLSDHPDDQACRDNAAMAQVASLLPADSAEAELACKFVGACAHAMDCLRLVDEHAAELAIAMKCRAQAISMMRQACMARSLLLRIQEARRKRPAPGDTSANELPWSDHGLLDRVTEALGRPPAHAPKAGPEEERVPETPEPAVSLRDAHPAAASVRTDALAEDLPVAQIVPIFGTGAENGSNETLARLNSPASPIDDTPDRLEGPRVASRPPHRVSERLEALMERVVASVAPSKRNLSASDAVTIAMNRPLHPAVTMPGASAA